MSKHEMREPTPDRYVVYRYGSDFWRHHAKSDGLTLNAPIYRSQAK